MLKLMIFSSSKDTAVTVFNNSVDTVKKIRTSCELVYVTDIGVFSDRISEKEEQYDILITDARDENGEAAAEKFRRNNIKAAVIVIAETEKLPGLLIYRPSGFVPDFSDKQKTEIVLTAVCREQLALNRFFTVKTKESILRIRHSEILYFESRKRIVVLHTRTKTMEFYAKLSEVLDILPPGEFIRCHQSFIVNLNYIKGMDKTNRCFYTADDLTIEISKSNYQQVAAAYEHFLGINRP